MKTIPIDQALEGMILAADVVSADDTIHALTSVGTVLTASTIKRLQQYGVKELSIVSDDTPAEKRPVIEIPKMTPTISEELRDEALDNLEELFSITEIGEDTHHSAVKIVRHIDAIVERLVESVLDDKNSLVNVNDLRSYDEYTYHHSLSVAVLSIAIGQSYGLPSNELEQVGRSAIMHDIGKTAIPKNILNKPSRLSDKEFVQMKLHSEEGYKYLASNHIGDKTLQEIVLLHHEKFDGTGYPLGLKGNQIPLASRIISIADVYDALTSDRPYRSPMQESEAIEFIMANAGTHFDFDIVTAFLRKIDLYPVGSIVELSTGKFAVVTDNTNSMRPVVRLLCTGEVLDLYTDYRYLSVTIIKVLTEEVVENMKLLPLQ